VQALGETPSVLPDVPVNIVFLLLFVSAAAANMALFNINLRRGKKFVINGMMFGFCFTRILATIFRMAWACLRTSVKIGIAAMVCVYAGIILLFIANLFFTQRIVRAQHPSFGWSKPFTLALPILLAIIVGSVICLIVSVILSFYTLNPTSLQRIRDIEKYGETLYAVVAGLPIPIVLASTVACRARQTRQPNSVDKFGAGSMHAKIAIVLTSAVFLELGACWRAAVLYLPDPETTDRQHPWYLSEACFYIFDFTIEICVVLFWLAVRIDRRFYIPNGAHGPFSYAGGFTFAGDPGNEKVALGRKETVQQLTSSSQISTTKSNIIAWGGSQNSMARDNRIPCGVIPQDAVSAGRAENGFQVVPYAISGEQDRREIMSSEVGVEGADMEMGWDPKSGKWVIRPILSSMSRRVSTKSEF